MHLALSGAYPHLCACVSEAHRPRTLEQPQAVTFGRSSQPKCVIERVQMAAVRVV